MGSYEWLPAKASDIPYLAANMRQSDKDELWAMGHLEPTYALEHSLKISTDARTAFLNGVPCAMFGVAPCKWQTAYGAVWMMGTDDLENRPVSFYRQSKLAIAEMQAHFPALVNYVDARHTKAIHWLKWLGAEIHEAHPYGVDGLPFHFFLLWR